MKFLAKRGANAGDELNLDTGIMAAVKSAETRAGMLTKSLRISHVLWATNEYLSACSKRDSDRCPLCGSARETNDHLKGQCQDEQLKEIRARMVTNIATEVEKELGDKMPDEAWQAVAALWSTESLTEAYPDKAPTTLTGIKCKSCRKGHRCQYRGREGHLPTENTPEPPSESDSADEAIVVGKLLYN